MQSSLEVLAPLAHRIEGLDLSDGTRAAEVLERDFPASMQTDLRAALLAEHAAGTLTPRDGGAGIRFGRVAKASPETANHSIDAVDIEGAGAEHTHPRGEISFCIALSGSPRFDGHPEGWVVLPIGSHHAPTVTGGRMLIVYFLPGGEVRWGPRAE
ncbi:MAG: DUF4863 family protein [Proteobacteria bacterium]|nr:DUF4863 family protein [Pseudomonadota bacterium]